MGARPRGLEAFERNADRARRVAAFARRHADWDFTVSRCGGADPGGPMDDALFDAFLAEMERDFRGRTWDAVYLSLHGALATPRHPDADRDIVRFVRGIVGEGVPIGVSFDMHAQSRFRDRRPCRRRRGLQDAAASRHARHGGEGAGCDGRQGRGPDPAGGRAARPPGKHLHSFNMRTSDGPMKELRRSPAAGRADRSSTSRLSAAFPAAELALTGASAMVYADGDRRRRSSASPRRWRPRSSACAGIRGRAARPEAGLRTGARAPPGTARCSKSARQYLFGRYRRHAGAFRRAGGVRTEFVRSSPSSTIPRSSRGRERPGPAPRSSARSAAAVTRVRPARRVHAEIRASPTAPSSTRARCRKASRCAWAAPRCCASATSR